MRTHVRGLLAITMIALAGMAICGGCGIPDAVKETITFPAKQ